MYSSMYNGEAVNLIISSFFQEKKWDNEDS